MSSTYNYNPIPPRVWSRVQNRCTYIMPNNSYNSVYIPLTNQTTSLAQANYEDKLIYKGNILQYKGNSSRLTKSQKYTQIAKGYGPSRTKSFATQSQTYTNPNTSGLLRVNYDSIPYPNQLVGKPNNISGPYQYDVPNPFDCSSNYLQDGGTLVCGTYANPCTGEIIKHSATSATICNPSYCSDVPGTPIELCWNKKVQTWFPRHRYFMNNSTDKWPQGYKGFVSAVTPDAPVLLSAIEECGDVNLSWAFVFNACIPISSFNIYQNNLLIKTVPSTITSAIINNLEFNIVYSFYVTALIDKSKSLPSNSINVTLIVPTLSLTGTGIDGVVELNWSFNESNCYVNYYNIYQNGIIIQTVSGSSTNVTISGIPYNNGSTSVSYVYFVEAIFDSVSSIQSNTFTYTLGPLYSATGYTAYNNNGYSAIVFADTTIISGSFTFNDSIPTCNFIMIGGGGGGGLQAGSGPHAVDRNNGGGGSGGGVYITNSFTIVPGITGTTSIGTGGLGAGYVLSDTNNGEDGKKTQLTYSSNTYISTGGNGSDGGNGTIAPGMPAPYGSGYVEINATIYNNYYGGWGGVSNASISTDPYYLNGGPYYDNTGGAGGAGSPNVVQLPFISNLTTIIPSGGGGGATLNTSGSATPNQYVQYQYGGKSGGIGLGLGNGGYATNSSGENSLNTILYNSTGSFGGGGGGGVGTPNDGITQGTYYTGGNGGSGVIIIYWANLTF